MRRESGNPTENKRRHGCGTRRIHASPAHTFEGTMTGEHDSATMSATIVDTTPLPFGPCTVCGRCPACGQYRAMPQQYYQPYYYWQPMAGYHTTVCY